MVSANHDSCRRIHLFQKPSKQFIIGSLADSSKAYTVGKPTGENKIQTKSALRHNSLSLFFLIKRNYNGKISIIPSCSVFYKVFPDYKEQKEYIEKLNAEAMFESVRKDPGFIPQGYYKRLDSVFEPIECELKNGTQSLDFSSVTATVKSDDSLFRSNPTIEAELKGKGIKNHFDPEWVKNEEIFNAKLTEIKTSLSKKSFNWEAIIEIEREYFDELTDIITVRMINTTKQKVKFEKFLFNCNLEVELKGATLVPFEYQFKYEEYKYDTSAPLRTLNCHADYFPKTNKIITKPFAIFEQTKRIPRITVSGVSAEFQELKSSLEPLDLLLAVLQEQLNKYKSHPMYKNEDLEHYKQYKEETANFQKIIQRFEEGLEILKSDEKAISSFYAMNEVFEIASNYEGWRIFQIVFIVMLVPDIVKPTSNRDIVDVIHVNTGGGKSEAYFGLVLFTLFWDRLRGKSLGVSAISKFPLRMLSIQQLQRIAKIVVIADEIKNKKGIEGEPFSVGYYVGVSDDFPRYTYDKIEEVLNSEKKGDKIKGVLLDSCPFCNSKIVLKVDEIKRKIVHICETCNKDYFLYFTNSEVYRFLPSLIVSTVDKLASVALNRRFKNLIGGKLSICKNNHGFTPRNDSCEVFTGYRKKCQAETAPFEKQIEGPTLMIQDEMHLLREGFGTINSHFESLLNTLLKKFSNKEFKYVTMTATVSGAKTQIGHLYGKNYFIFPGKTPRGYRKEEDVFFEDEKNRSGQNITQRILIGLKPNLRDNQYASLLTLFHLTTFIQKVKENKTTYASKYGISIGELEYELKKYQCILTYHSKKADVFGINYFLHTVVTSKLENYEIIHKPLTGDNSLAEIKETITTIQNFPDQIKNNNKLHATFATSVVSHGVDIDNWNLMIFQGITKDTSEYIQALSRVGRRYTGLIFLWFYPNRVRDLSYYKNFNLYHNILQLKVEKTPISRWAKLGFKQTFTSVFCASILNYMSELEEKPLYKVEAVNSLFDDVSKRKLLIDFIQEAYYTSLREVGVSWIRDQIANEVEERLNYLKRYSSSIGKNFFPNALKDSMDKYYKTQYGMRGIQEQITLKLNENYTNFIHKYQKRV
jgi:hypothetical protein